MQPSKNTSKAPISPHPSIFTPPKLNSNPKANSQNPKKNHKTNQVEKMTNLQKFLDIANSPSPSHIPDSIFFPQFFSKFQKYG
jgi:hypothetical protein